MSEHSYSADLVARAVQNMSAFPSQSFLISQIMDGVDIPAFAHEDFGDHLQELGFIEKAGLSHFAITDLTRRRLTTK